MDINLVKIVNNGVNLVKIGHLGQNVPNALIFGCKNNVICQNFGKVVKKIFTNQDFDIGHHFGSKMTQI